MKNSLQAVLFTVLVLTSSAALAVSALFAIGSLAVVLPMSGTIISLVVFFATIPVAVLVCDKITTY